MGPGLELLTPPGPAGVAVLQFDPLTQKEMLGLLGLSGVAAGSARLVHPRWDGEVLDEGLLVGRPDGGIELHVHGSQALIEKLLEIEVSVDPDCHHVGAFGLEGTALSRVPRAPCAAGARLLLDQGAGVLRVDLEKVLRDPGSSLIQELISQWGWQRYWLRAARVVLAGPVNGGKSTLFNLMIGEQHALTSSEEGTTRDAVEGRGHLGCWPIHWIDTAGERPGAPLAVERAGQEQARVVAAQADLVLRLVPAGSTDPEGRSRGRGIPEVALSSRGDLDESVNVGAASGIDVLGAPQEAQRRVRELVLEGLQLPAEWERSPGQAAIFDQTQLEALEALQMGDPLPLRALLRISD